MHVFEALAISRLKSKCCRPSNSAADNISTPNLSRPCGELPGDNRWYSAKHFTKFRENGEQNVSQMRLSAY